MRKNFFSIAVSMTIILSVFCQNSARAQGPQKVPAKPIICPAKFEDMHSRVNIKDNSKAFQLRAQDAATAEILVTYGPGAEANPEARAAFQYALDIWSNQIVSPVPIKIFADFADLGSGVLASAGPSYFVSEVPNAPDPDVLYPAALANAIAGVVLFPDEEFDLVVNLGNGIPWYFGTDGNTPAGQFDFVTVALHEAGHGLGFTAIRSYDNITGIGSIRSGDLPSIYGIFMVDGDGDYLIDFPDPSVEIGDAFTGGDLFVDGTFAKAALGGIRPELYAPSTFQGGSSIAHWDEVAFPAGDPNSLMSPQVGSAEANHDIGDITRGHFKDMGWVINDAGAPSLIASPSSLSEELSVGDIITQTINISNISDETINALITSNVGSSTIELLNPSELLIPSTESSSFDVTINTTNLLKGIYQDTIYVRDIVTDESISIPVTVRVIDGTEAPLISVLPESFNETTEQFQVITRDLTIQNTGDADLNYSITINDGTESNFSTLVKTSQDLIHSNGFTKSSYSSSSSNIRQAQLFTNTDGINKVVSSLYATDFEEFTVGDINSQLGWASQFTDNWIISNENSFEAAQHFRGISDGLGGSRPAGVLAFSPTITPGDEPFMVLSAALNIQGSGVTWEIIPQSPTAGSVNTRLRFNPDNTIDVLSGSDFVRVNAAIPEGYFDFRLVIDKDDSTFAIYFNNELVFSGQGFAPLIEQVVLLSNMEVVGSTMDIDNLEITDGDPDAFFLSASPTSGTVPFGSSNAVSVKFDARTLVPGSYSATLNINSDDETNPSIDIPVSLTVLAPPTAEITPESLSASVNVKTDIPATKTEVFTVTNSGESPLEFTTSLGAIGFTPPLGANAATYESLDLAKYGKGNTGFYEEKSVGKSEKLAKTKNDFYLNDAVTFSDSIYYDSGIPFPDNFSGVQTAAYTSAINFDVESDFTLTAVRNGYTTEALANPVIILEIYRGGATPNEGELLLTQTFDVAGPDGILVAEVLNQSLSFSAGESFWVVHKYPDGIEFPQGVDDSATQRPDTYFFSSDGGDTYSPSGFVFFVRALSGGATGSYITLEPSSGTVAPNESVNVSVTFDGATLANGTYNTDILLSSNDPASPVKTVATTFDVSGQESEIVISDEFLLFNNVFIGAEKELSFEISNTGLDQLNISSISSDNPNFTLDVSSATIIPDGSLDVVVTFTPTSTGNINGIITIESNASNASTLEVILNGVGVDPPIAILDPLEVFETTDAGTTIDSEIALKNEGQSPLIYSFPDLAVAQALAKPDVQLNNTEYIKFKDFSPQQEKGFSDSRVGAPVEYSIGTDSGFGYSWIDSDENGGPVYNFTDISTTGTEISDITFGDGSAEVPLSFPFEFYGTVNNNIFINANGFLTFQPTENFTWVNGQIPSDEGINNVIAGMWTDLEPQNDNGTIHYEGFNDKFIVQWTQAPFFLGPDTQVVTFQIVLYPNGNIDVFYEDVESSPIITNATVGIENADGSDGAQVAFNTSYIKDGLALRFVKPTVSLTSFISNVSPLSGVVPAGGSRNLTVTSDATNLNDGVYYDELVVSSNDPVNTANTSLFELTVIGYPEILVTPEELTFEGIFTGLSSEGSVLIQNIGSKALEISSITNQNSDFVIDAEAPLTLFPDQSYSFDVTFSPTSVGLIEDEITIVSNDSFGNENLGLLITAEGIDPPVVKASPELFDLTITKGQSVEEIVSIANTGGSTLNYSIIPPYFGRAGEANQEVQKYEKLEYQKISSKEALDTRVGPKFLNVSGGPGTFGYTWADNNSGGPEYDFIDISATGELIDVGADGNTTVPLPFTFNFFGNDENSVTIAANGYLTFAPITGIDYVNEQIPDTGSPNLFIAPMWTDIEPQDGDGVFIQGNEDYFIVQYENNPGFGFPGPDPVTFQVILFPDGSIKMQYENVDSNLRTQSTVGIEGPQGLSGLQVIFNTEYLTDELAITFSPPLRGALEPGETTDIPVLFSTEELEAEVTYTGDIRISSNDPITPEATIPVTVNVLSPPEVVSFTLIDATSNEEIGPLTEGLMIDLDNFSANSFSVLANIGTADVGSVVFDLNDIEGYQTENIAPYALNGDFSEGTKYHPVEFPIGINTITATPYTGSNGSGEAGIPLTIAFEVFRTNAAEVVSFTLINTKTNQEIGTLSEGDVIDLNNYPRNRFSVVANIGEVAVGSVIFDFNGEANFQTENIAPYALNGDYEKRMRRRWGRWTETRYYPVEFEIGTNTITATPYSRSNGNGEMGNALTVNFEVIDSNSPEEIEVLVYPNPVINNTTVSLKGNASKLNGVIYDLSGNIVRESIISMQNEQGEAQINMSGLRQGIYVLQIINDKGELISQVKVIKK